MEDEADRGERETRTEQNGRERNRERKGKCEYPLVVAGKKQVKRDNMPIIKRQHVIESSPMPK